MAHLVSLTYGSTTVNMYGTSGSEAYLGLGWSPVSPQPGAVVVSEAIPLDISSTTTDLVRAKIRAIQRALNEGMNYTTSNGAAGNRTFLNFQPGEAGTNYYTEVYGGWVDVTDPEALAGSWAAKNISVTVHVLHAPFWQAADGNLQITSNQTTTPSSTAVIYLPCPTYTAAVTFVDGGGGADTITDAANGLAIFKTGDVITVRGSVSNDGDFTIVTGGVAGTITLATATVTAEGPVAVTIIGPVQNWVQVAASAATNTVPCPVRLELYNGTNDADELTTVWAGHNAHNNPATLTPATYTLEAEHADATEASAGMADTDEETDSGGAYSTATEAGNNEVCAFRWDLAAGTVDLFKGGRYRIVARLATNSAGNPAIPAAYCRVAVTYPAATAAASCEDIATTDTTLLDTSDHYQDLGELKIPPWLRKSGFAQRAISIMLYARKTGGFALALDFIMAIPMDSFVTYEPYTGGVEYQEELIDNRGDEGGVAVFTTTSAGTYDARGQPLILYPGTINRYYFLANSDGGEIGRTATVEIKVNLRRPTL